MKHAFFSALTTFSLLFLAASVSAQEWADAFRRQTEHIEIDAGVVAEILRFDEKGHSLPDEYAAALAQWLREISFSKSASQLEIFQEGICEEVIEVDFLKDGLQLQDFPLPLGDAEKEFQKGFLRVEVVYCFPDITRSAKDALMLYTSAEFRLSVSSTLKRIDENQGVSCVETKGIPAILSATLYCNRVQNFFAEGMAIQHSQVIENPEPDEYQNVYFKESLKSFVEFPGGGLGFHYINYSRSDKMGALKRGLGKNSIVSSQKKALEKLRERLRN
jgi:hypothetical protein